MIRERQLLERESVIARLHGMLDRASDGRGSLALISGEAGVGKTSLVRTFVDRVDADVLVGACDPLSTPRPLSPIVDIAADATTGFAGLLRSGAASYDVFAELLVHLKRSLRPTLLVIEDVHWADEATLDLLRYLGRRIGDTHSLVLATYRDDEVTRAHPLFPVVGDLQRQRDSVVRIPVEPLSLAAVQTLAGDRAIDTDELMRLTGGNAFFVTELLAADGALPASVHDAVLARVARVGAEAQRIVEAVAIAPRDLRVDHAVALAGAAAEAIDEAASAAVIRVIDDALSYRHELARAAVESAIPTVRCVTLHRRMIELLEADGSTDTARLAHHAIRTGDRELIIRYAPAAAIDARARGAGRQAADFYGAALEHHVALDTAEELRLRTEYLAALSLIDDQAGALAQAETVLRLSEQLGDQEQIGRATTLLGRAAWASGDNERARRLHATAIGLLEPLGESAALANALSNGGHLAMLNRRHDRAFSLAYRGLDVARRVGADQEVANGTLILGTVELATGDGDRGIELMLDAIPLFEALGNETAAVLCYVQLGSGGGEVRTYGRAVQWLDEAIARGRRIDGDGYVAYATAWRARIACEQGRWDEAVDVAETIARLPDEVAAIAPVTALGALGRVRVRRGDPGAEDALRRAIELGSGGSLQHIWTSLCALAELHWLRGDSAAAVAVLEEPLARVLETDTPWGRGELAFWMWWVGGIGDDDVPDRIAEPFALHMAGDWEGAAAAWREIGCPYEEALALGCGDPDAMLRGLEILDRLGARPAAAWLRSRLREAGVDTVPRGPRRTTREHPAGLTPRQAEVLELIAEGLANGDIAGRLFISKKTVEHHVSAILAKLEVATRAEAIEAAQRLASDSG